MGRLKSFACGIFYCTWWKLDRRSRWHASVISRTIVHVEKWTRRGLNPRPSACKADVIPLHHEPGFNDKGAGFASMMFAIMRNTCPFTKYKNNSFLENVNYNILGISPAQGRTGAANSVITDRMRRHPIPIRTNEGPLTRVQHGSTLSGKVRIQVQTRGRKIFAVRCICNVDYGN